MDRRKRALLSGLCAAGLALLAGTDRAAAGAPEPGSAPGPSPRATPWVEAPPSPAATPTPTPAPRPAVTSAVVPAPPRGPAKSSPPEPKGSAANKPPPSPEDLRKEMQHRRQAELDQTREQDFSQAEEKMSPEERRLFERNLRIWRGLTPEERQSLRGQADQRIRDETAKVYADSGLALSSDQQEVFALRYRQERRRLERDIQERSDAERARRFPEIVEKLKREFNHGASAPAGAPPKASPTPAVSASVSPSPSPTPTPTPKP